MQLATIMFNSRGHISFQTKRFDENVSLNEILGVMMGRDEVYTDAEIEQLRDNWGPQSMQVSGDYTSMDFLAGEEWQLTVVRI